MANKTTASTMTRPHRPAHRDGRLRPVRTFFIASVLYFFLSLRELSQWTPPVWFVLAFLVIPGSMAFLLGWGKGMAVKTRIRATFWSVGLAVLLYTSINLVRIHSRIGSSGSFANGFLVGLVVSLTYAALATGVCVLVGLVWERLMAAKEQNNR